MNLTGIELRYLVNEIGGRLSGGYYVSNIYGIARDSLLFKMHHPQRQDVFVMLTTSGMWVTANRIDSAEPNRLLKRLRNDLLRARIVKIEQIGAERITYLTFNNFEKEFVLVAEMFGDGNMILCGADMKILALLHSIDVRHRKLAVGLQYNPPPSNSIDILDMDRSHFDGISGSEVESVRWVGRNLGLPKKYSEQIFRVADIDPSRQASTLSEQEIDCLFAATSKLIQDVVGGNHRSVIVRTQEKAEVYPVEIGGSEVEHVSSFMEGLDLVFTEEIVAAGRAIQSGTTNKKVEECQSQLEEQAKAIETVKQRSGQITAAAEAIIGFAAMGILSMEDGRVQDLLREGRYAELVRHRGIPYIKVLDERIRINPGSSMQSVASILFDEAKRQSRAIPTIERQMRMTEKKMAKLRGQSKSEESVGFQQIAKRAWFQRYRWFFTSDGMIAVGGRDSSSNSAVIRKHLEKNDRVFHAEIFGSPFFILKDSVDATPSSLNEVAHATVCFSRAWRESMYGMSAYWVEPGQIKKAAPSGQFLPKGSFIIEGRRNFVKISSLRLAVGVLQYNDGILLTCGPPEPVKRQCVCYAVIEPGGSRIGRTGGGGEMAEAAKRIRAKFAEMHDGLAGAIPLDEFVRVLPAGGSRVTEIGEGLSDGIR